MEKIRKLVILSIAVGLSIILVIAWLYLNQPSVETLLIGKIMLTRSAGTTMEDWFSHGFFYEFDVSQNPNLRVKFEQEGEAGEIFWYLFNITRKTLEIRNETRNDFLVAEGTTDEPVDRTISLKTASNYTFVLLLAAYSHRQAVTVMLELYQQ